MKKVEDILKNNREHESIEEENLKKAMEFLKKNPRQGFTNEEIDEKFDTTFLPYPIFYSNHPLGPIFKNLVVIRETETNKEYFFYQPPKDSENEVKS